MSFFSFCMSWLSWVSFSCFISSGIIRYMFHKWHYQFRITWTVAGLPMDYRINMQNYHRKMHRLIMAASILQTYVIIKSALSLFDFAHIVSNPQAISTT